MDMKPTNTPDVSPSVEVHIEELILRGFAANDHLQIGAAIEQELSRLIAQQGIQCLRTAPNLDHLDAGTIQLAANARPQAVGQNVAQRVYGQLSPTSIRPSQQQPKEARSKP